MSLYAHAPDVIATDLGDELILLDPRNGEMFGLNASGRRVWLELPHASANGVVDRVCAEFDVTPDRARDDVAALLDALTKAELIVRARRG
jgi:hypothetical protein